MNKRPKMSLFGFLKKIHRSIPSRVQRFYMPWVAKWSYKIQKQINIFYPAVYIVKGLEKNSQFPLVFAYAGFDAQDLDYWAKAVLSMVYQKHRMGRHFFWAVRSFIKKGSFNCAFILQEHNWLTLKYIYLFPGFCIPFWINLEMDITLPFKELLGRQKLDMQRRIRKNGLSYSISHDVQDFDDFYYNMFLPYIKGRHEQSAILGSYTDLAKAFSKGGLILIKKGDNVLAGGLYELDGALARLRRFGVRDGKWEYVSYGVLGAAYYLFTLEMKEKGYAKTNLGGARPLLNDGITKYKISMNVQLDQDEKSSCLWMSILNDSEGFRKFLVNNPFIFYNKKADACRAIFVEVNQDTAPEELERVINAPICGGIKETHLFVYGEIDLFSSKVDYAKLPALRVYPAENMFMNRLA